MLEEFLDRFREKGPSRPRTKAEKERRRRLLIVLLIVLAVVSSVSIVVYGYYSTSVRPWHQRILKVNGTVFDMRDFVKMMNLYQATSADYADSVISTMEENELQKQELENTYEVSIDEDAVDAELRGMLVSENATDEEFEEQLDVLAANLKTNYGLSVRDIKELYIRPSLVTEELKKQIGDAQYPATDNVEYAQVQALLVTGSDNATQLRARWEAGESFETLAEEGAVSDSLGVTTSDNTEIEWVAKGIRSEAFDTYVFSATLGVLSEPIQETDDTGSYWLIRVVARESRSLSESDRDTLVSQAYSEWLEAAKNSEENKIINYLNQKKVDWALDHVTVSTS